MRGVRFTTASALDSPASSQCRIAASLKRCRRVEAGDSINALMFVCNATRPAPRRRMMDTLAPLCAYSRVIRRFYYAA
jgi:hypothetical protein